MKTSAVSSGLGQEHGRSRLFSSNEQNLGSPVKVCFVQHKVPCRLNLKADIME